MSMPWSLPDNLARIRKVRNLSQEQLAAASGVAVDTIARIERAERKTTRPLTVSKLAAALSVSADTLLGIPTAESSASRADVAGLRSAITGTQEIPGLADFTEDDEVLPVATLAATAHQAWRAYVDGRHAELLTALPSLLVDARRLVHATAGDQQAAAHRVLSTTYRLGAGLAGRFDLDDLAWTSAERALRSARECDSVDLETANSSDTSYGRWFDKVASRTPSG
jgi:transcriptional regulator with XRE-family HTH domain